MKQIILLLSLSAQTLFAAGLNQGLDKNSIVIQAHESFLQGDYHQTLMNIKTGLEQFDRDLIMKKNLLALYGNLLHAGKLKGVDVGWTLPKEMRWFSLSVEREVDNKELKYSLIFGGSTLEANSIKSFKVVRFPDIVVIDKENNIGKFREQKDDEGLPAFYFRTQKGPQPIAAGLYHIEIKTEKGSTLKAWTIIDETMNAESSPEFLKLTAAKPIFKTNQPKFFWKDFKFSPTESGENRGLFFEISRNINPNSWESLWDHWEKEAKSTQLQVGKDSNHMVNKLPLENGDYMALLQYSEWTRFGEMRFTHKSTSIIDFTIQTKK